MAHVHCILMPLCLVLIFKAVAAIRAFVLLLRFMGTRMMLVKTVPNLDLISACFQPWSSLPQFFAGGEPLWLLGTAITHEEILGAPRI